MWMFTLSSSGLVLSFWISLQLQFFFSCCSLSNCCRLPVYKSLEVWGKPVYSLSSWLLSMKVISRPEPQSTIFFFLAFPFRVDQPQIHDLWLLQTRNATPLELYWLPSPTCLWWRCLPKCFNCHLQKWEIWHIFYSFLSRVSRVMAPKMTTSYILGPVCNVGNRRKRN